VARDAGDRIIYDKATGASTMMQMEVVEARKRYFVSSLQPIV
jgi:hypothetical protein